MIAAGVRKFACGVGSAKSLRPRKGGGVHGTDGPYLETKEHIGRLWIFQCADMEEALAWARKGVGATRGQVEVREILFVPAPEWGCSDDPLIAMEVDSAVARSGSPPGSGMRRFCIISGCARFSSCLEIFVLFPK